MAYRVDMHQAVARLQTLRITSRYMQRVLDDLHDGATRGASGGQYSNGHLASTIFKRGPVPAGLSVTGTVGSDLHYARFVERGARVHNIFPKNAAGAWRFGDRRAPQLKFRWRGRVVYTPHVPMSPGTIGLSHPGQTGRHFLLKAVIKTATKYRLRYVVHEI